MLFLVIHTLLVGKEGILSSLYSWGTIPGIRHLVIFFLYISEPWCFTIRRSEIWRSDPARIEIEFNFFCQFLLSCKNNPLFFIGTTTTDQNFSFYWKERNPFNNIFYIKIESFDDSASAAKNVMFFWPRFYTSKHFLFGASHGSFFYLDVAEHIIIVVGRPLIQRAPPQGCWYCSTRSLLLFILTCNLEFLQNPCSVCCYVMWWWWLNVVDIH